MGMELCLCPTEVIGASDRGSLRTTFNGEGVVAIACVTGKV